MNTATALEVSACSTTGFDDAINRGIHQACPGLRDLRKLRSAHVNDQQILLENGCPARYQVSLKITFMQDGERPAGV